MRSGACPFWVKSDITTSNVDVCFTATGEPTGEPTSMPAIRNVGQNAARLTTKDDIGARLSELQTAGQLP